MKASELKELQLLELKKELISLLGTQFGLRMRLATQQLQDFTQLRKIRRDIARIKTVITQKSNKS